MMGSGGRSWEACQTLNGSWGYHRDKLDWKTADQLVRMLVDTVAKGGNLLLNVGPTGRGEFDAGIRASVGPSAMDAPARPLDLRRRAPPATRPGRTAATPGAATGSTSTSSPGPSGTAPGRVAGRVSTRSSSTTHRRCAIEVIDPAQQAQNTTMAALGTDVLTLNLPVRQPDVDVPVIELFLTPGR